MLGTNKEKYIKPVEEIKTVLQTIKNFTESQHELYFDTKCEVTLFESDLNSLERLIAKEGFNEFEIEKFIKILKAAELELIPKIKAIQNNGK